MHIEQETQRQPGPDIVIDCPACLARGVPASTYDQRIQERLYGAVSVNDVRTTWAACSNCKVALRSRVPAAQLAGKTSDELAELIYADASFLQKSLAVIALVLSVFPCVGTAMAAVAFLANRKMPSWPKTISLCALAFSILLPVVGIGVIIALSAVGVIK